MWVWIPKEFNPLAYPSMDICIVPPRLDTLFTMSNVYLPSPWFHMAEVMVPTYHVNPLMRPQCNNHPLFSFAHCNNFSMRWSEKMPFVLGAKLAPALHGQRHGNSSLVTTMGGGVTSLSCALSELILWRHLLTMIQIIMLSKHLILIMRRYELMSCCFSALT